MQTQRPRLLVVDDDRTILTLTGTGVTCSDVLRALRDISPHCEVMLMSGNSTLDAAVEAVKRGLQDPLGGALPSAFLEAGPPRATVPLAEVERAHIVRTLEHAGGNKAVAARRLGISRRAFYRHLERHGLHHRAPDAGRVRVAVGQ